MSLVRRIFGGDVDEAIRPLVVLQLFGSLSASALFSFMGIWGSSGWVRRRRASASPTW